MKDVWYLGVLFLIFIILPSAIVGLSVTRLDWSVSRHDAHVACATHFGLAGISRRHNLGYVVCEDGTVIDFTNIKK